MPREYACHAHLLGHEDTAITFPVGAQLVGCRLRDIHVRLTAAELIDPRVREWLLEVVLPRRASPGEVVHVELGGVS